MNCQVTWSTTGVLSSHPSSGRRSAPSLGCRPAYLPDSTPNQPVGRSQPGPRNYSALPGLRQPPHLEPAACVGWICPQPPSLLCHGPITFWVFPGGISPRSSLSRKKRSAYLLPRCLSATVVVPGGEPGRSSSRPPPGIDDKQIDTGHRRLSEPFGAFTKFCQISEICWSG